ncbi:MAG: hypothetical protein M1825_005951 [Sarcosagium campestre]|nr:MAG: hypothetical protein M1825_005951 [Sarcosagium campestre]
MGSQRGPLASLPNPIERLLSLQRHDPLSTLLFTCFASSSGPHSAEDLRRTEVWSTACARLINEGTPGSEHFLRIVLNTWASMRDWPLKRNLELFLKTILQDGAFLTNRTDEKPSLLNPQAGFHANPEATSSDKFFDHAVAGLFELMESDSYSRGIPEGVLELGTAIRILKEVAIRAQKYVWDTTLNWRQAAPVQPRIRSQIDKIVDRLRNPIQTEYSALPSKVKISPRDTAEIQPFLAICAADIKTLVNALYPEPRPLSSSQERDIYPPSIRSVASSISGLSYHFQTRPSSHGTESESVFSNSSSSLSSDMTSREPLLDAPSQNGDGTSSFTSFTSRETLQYPSDSTSTENYGQHLKSCISELTRILGTEAVAGTCHPCAEDWALLYISFNGKDLTTKTRKDWGDDGDDDGDSSSDEGSDLGDSNPSIGLERDFHQVKEAIYRLIEEFEIPQSLSPEWESKSFSNRGWNTRRGVKTSLGSSRSDASPNRSVQSQNPSRESYSPNLVEGIIMDHSEATFSEDQSQENVSQPSRCTQERESQSILLIMMESAMKQSQSRADFVSAQYYWRSLEQLQQLSTSSLARDGFGPLLSQLCWGPRDSLWKCAGAIEEIDAWFVWVKQSLGRQDATMEELMTSIDRLRDKMWFVTDVKNSGAYEETKSIAHALGSMDPSQKIGQIRMTLASRARSLHKAAATGFLQKTKSQVFDLLTAPKEQGGPCKLSDDQSDLTLKWLARYDIENLCKGEERIHRFYLEIDRCVERIVGSDILGAPVLWSSELFQRDRASFDSSWDRSGLGVSAVEKLAAIGSHRSERDRRPHTQQTFGHASRSSMQDLRATSLRNVSQQSFDSGRWSAVGSHDGNAVSGATLGMDTSTTFWSPLDARASTPPRSSAHPASEASSHRYCNAPCRQSDDSCPKKREFLNGLKQDLVGLLLSDLGPIVLTRGSETDGWFSSDLGEQCIRRQEEKEISRRLRLSRRNGSEVTTTADEPRPMPSESEDAEHLGPLGQTPASADQGAVNRETVIVVPRWSGSSTASVTFPYDAAFRTLVKRFSIESSPFTKLRVLWELELLIIASLGLDTIQKGSGCEAESGFGLHKTPNVRSSPQPTAPRTMLGPRAKTLDDVIANCEERRSQTIMWHGHAPYFRGPNWTNVDAQSASTDPVVGELQRLFKDPEIRPRTLFQDLQLIASFVPSDILDETACGRAFWDASLAALTLKQDVCNMMVEIADDIVGYHTKNRSLSPTRRGAEGGQSSELARFSMEDAARMWTITAKEGDAVAQRELAIFYLTHPDLLARTILPLSRPRDVFKAQVMDQSNEDPMRSDPATMCVAYHWMELSSQGGDDLASKYLRSREEMNALP